MCVLAGALLSGIGVTLVKFRGCNREQPELSPLHSQGFLCSFQTSQAHVRSQVAKVCCDSEQQFAPALDYLHTLQISAEFLHGFGTGQVPGARRREEKAGGRRSR